MGWTDRAACVGQPTILFFPTGTGPLDALDAKAVCADCPVQDPCLEYGLRTHSDGVWGGTTEAERDRMRPNGRYQLWCESCDQPFHAVNRGKKWCDTCLLDRRRVQNREAQRARRAGHG